MTTSEQTARRVYSAEQLHRLRSSFSAPKLREAIEEHDGEDADLVKEHVLRGSKSFAARSLRSREPVSNVQFAPAKSNDENIAVFADDTQDPLQPPTIVTSKPQVLGEIANNGQALRQPHWRLRTSPTPSIRKSRIEALVKHHGSPQHVRVTAGGRIVPSEQSPLCHPRFGYSAIKNNGTLIKVAPNHVGKAQWTNATQDGYVAQDINGRLCQIVNGMIMPINEENGELRLYMPAPNLNFTQRGPSVGTQAGFEESGLYDRPQDDSQVVANAAPQPSVATQKNALELEYSKLDQELKDLNKTEVLHGRTMAKTAKEALFTKRRQLVTSMDQVRKSLKSLKDFPQDAQVPTSPKAMRDRHSMSPQRDRLPPFLQRGRQTNSVSAPAIPVSGQWQPPGQPVFGAMPPMHIGAPLAVPNMAGSNGSFTALPYQMPPPGAFMPPPPFDGSMGAPFPIYQDAATAAMPIVPTASGNSNANPAGQPNDRLIPQQDGSSSTSDVKMASPRLSHALPIKNPETKQITNIKSVLNPKSPIYKPNSEARQPAPLGDRSVAGRSSTLHTAKRSSGIDGRASPAKKITTDHSSVSSVRTADFFPRNTREYSMRKHEYPVPSAESEDKENFEPPLFHRGRTESHSPITPKRELHNTNWNPEIPDGAFVKFASPQTGSYATPTVPPGTPVNVQPEEQQKQPMLKIDGETWNEQIQYLNSAQMPDRAAHNLSPKSKRTWRFIEERPGQYESEESSSPVRDHQCREELCATASPYKAVEFSGKSHEWIQGHQAGLYRKPVSGDRMGDFLEGYCAGLIKSLPVTSVSTGISDGSPARPASRRPTPTPGQSGSSGHAASAIRPPMELSLQSLDSLKQAVYAPQNENALMTPAADSPFANEATFNLGGWQKRQQNMAALESNHPKLPQRGSSLVERQTNQDYQDESRRDSTQDSNTPLLQKAAVIGQGGQQHVPRVPTLAQARVTSGPAYPGMRVNSITSIDSTFQRPWSSASGPRVISPFDWKSTSSVAHAASLATGFFANSQYDGTADDLDPDHDAKLTHAAGITGALTAMKGPAADDWNRARPSLDGAPVPTNLGIPATTFSKPSLVDNAAVNPDFTGIKDGYLWVDGQRFSGKLDGQLWKDSKLHTGVTRDGRHWENGEKRMVESARRTGEDEYAPPKGSAMPESADYFQPPPTKSSSPAHRHSSFVFLRKNDAVSPDFQILPTLTSHKASKASSPSKTSSPPKSPSPAKATIEHIANKVGIAMSGDKKDRVDGSDGASPPAKKGWRSIWHGSSKKEGNKDVASGSKDVEYGGKDAGYANKDAYASGPSSPTH